MKDYDRFILYSKEKKSKEGLKWEKEHMNQI